MNRSTPRHAQLIFSVVTAALALAVWAPALALAEPPRIAVLTLADDAVDEKVSIGLTNALRSAVRWDDSVVLSDSHASLDQLSMANDCDPGSPACLKKIAKGLSVDALIYGSFEIHGSVLTLQARYFDARPGGSKTPKAAKRSFPAKAKQTDWENAANYVVGELLGHPKSAAAASSEVEAAPLADSEPASEAAPPAESKPAPVKVEPEYAEGAPSSGVSGRHIAGYTLLGVAVVSAGLSALSFVEIDRAQNDASLHAYRVAVGKYAPMVSDVCAEADANHRYGLSSKAFGNVRSSCGAGGTYEVLQFVFLGAALVSGGVSAYLLLGDRGSGSEGTEHASNGSGKLVLKPTFSTRSAGLSARMQF
ncbi:MAG TPA: hypothetical protein VHM19_22665 [Polyangiales bacterium]|jgi:hypothetical protein|nr:hypothetical protein [Polyangiales bacterium]